MSDLPTGSSASDAINHLAEGRHDESWEPRSSTGFPLSLILVSLAAWFLVIKILWRDWSADQQYSYGFLVPLLMLGLFLKRWSILPARDTPSKEGSVIAGLTASLSVLLLCLVTPMSEANPDWRPLGALASISVVAFSLGLIYLQGGKSWLYHLAFPVLFFLVSVPWPRNFEQSVMSTLVSWNSLTTIEILHWLGYEAMQQGNLIMIPAGILGIDEACSGIRSLQSGMMVALFFGEIFSLRLLRRVVLLVIALLAALLGNIARSALLAVIATKHGLASVESWHDPAGLMILLLTVGAVISSALIWKNTVNARKLAIAPSRVYSPYNPFGRFWELSLLLLLMASFTGTEWWFFSHETPVIVSPLGEWDLTPRSGPGIASVGIAPRTRELLFNPQGFSEKWITPLGEHGQVFYFRWPAGRTAVQVVQFMHNPKACLSSIGMKLRQNLPPVTVMVHGTPVVFTAWLFESGGKPVRVYNSMMLEGLKDGDGTIMVQDDSLQSRLRNLARGIRNRGQRLIEIALWNIHDEESARKALESYLSQSVMSRTPLPKQDRTTLRNPLPSNR